MLTPKEQLILDHLKAKLNARGGLYDQLVSRLGLEVIPSQAYHQSLAISARVDVLIQEFKKASSLPVTTRSTYSEPSAPRIFWSPAQMKEWITTTKATL
jgi:hypothetical protein